MDYIFYGHFTLFLVCEYSLRSVIHLIKEMFSSRLLVGRQLEKTVNFIKK